MESPLSLGEARRPTLTCRDRRHLVLGEIRRPGEVEIGMGVRRLGTSSVTLAQLVVRGGRPVASAETVIVHLDSAARKPAPLGVRAREVLAALTLPATGQPQGR